MSTKPTLHRVAVDVTQLLLELLFIADIEVVVALLLEVLSLIYQSSRYSLLERLERFVESCIVRLGGEQVYMIGHNNVTVDE
jgi:hypothetical protein